MIQHGKVKRDLTYHINENDEDLVLLKKYENIY